MHFQTVHAVGAAAAAWLGKLHMSGAAAYHQHYDKINLIIVARLTNCCNVGTCHLIDDIMLTCVHCVGGHVGSGSDCVPKVPPSYPAPIEGEGHDSLSYSIDAYEINN